MIDFVVHDRLAYFSGATAPFTPFLPPFHIRAIVHLTISDVSEHDSSFSVHKKFSVYQGIVGSHLGCCAATGEQSMLGAKYRLDAALD